MRPVLAKAWADIRRRRLQSLVILFVVLLASATTTVGLTLLQVAGDPYDRAFAELQGSHLQVYYDASKVSLEQLRGTASLIGASTASDPWPAFSPLLQHGTSKYGNLVLIGRDDPGGAVEKLRIVAGRWSTSPGEMVITRSMAEFDGLRLGDRLVSLDVADKPALTIVGEVIDVDEGSADTSTAMVWVSTSQFSSLVPPGKSQYKIGYRFASPPSESQLAGSVATLQHSLSPGAVADSVNYLLFKQVFNITNQIIQSFLLAFGIFALAASAAIVGNLVAGIVIASYREIGILKAIGFTPLQVVAALATQMLVPALAGCAVGTVAGTALSVPLVDSAAHTLGVPPQPAVSPLIDGLTLAGVLLVVTVAAVLPGLRAGRLRAALAISTGSAPTRRGSGLARLLRRTPLPAPVSLGLGDAFARPLRGILTVLAVIAGVATLTFAAGFRQGSEALSVLASAGRADVNIGRAALYPDSRLMADLAAQPETAGVVAMGGGQVVVPGVANPVNVVAFRGPSIDLGYPLVAGRWFNLPNEVVMPRAMLNEAHVRIGDSFTGTIDSHSVQLRVVGESFSLNNVGHEVWTDWSTLSVAAPESAPSGYFVFLRPHSDSKAYVSRVQAKSPDLLTVDLNHAHAFSPVTTINNVLLVLAAVLALIAAAGVFNTLLLNTRERARDTAIMRALGMAPGQVILVVTASAASVGLVGAIGGLPAGVAIYNALIHLIEGLIGNDMPRTMFDVFGPASLALTAAVGVGLAVFAALLPARWASRQRIAEVLHAE